MLWEERQLHRSMVSANQVSIAAEGHQGKLQRHSPPCSAPRCLAGSPDNHCVLSNILLVSLPWRMPHPALNFTYTYMFVFLSSTEL